MRAVLGRLMETLPNQYIFGSRLHANQYLRVQFHHTRKAVIASGENFQIGEPLLHSKKVAGPPSPVPVQLFRTQQFHTAQSKCINMFTPRDDTTFWGRTLKKLGFTEIPKSVLKASGYLIYMKLADEVDYMKFFKQCSLPDTFASWFMILELHVWLISTRLMQDGREGRIVRNSLIKAMWEDNDQKSKKLEGALPAARRKELQALNEQFHATMISYDEGLAGSDYILAGALWRRLLYYTDGGPATFLPSNFETYENHKELLEKVKALEMLVVYVRSQYVMLNQLSREQLLRKRQFKFVAFDESLFGQEPRLKMEEEPFSAGIKRSARSQ